ncbi:hypothetical protein AAV99_11790 [Aurantiacibacter marinus]|uniref:JmjC domain-containing protein n=1 Tax=Aurantiacibacter marinus TaxID=874156 RepID=A0A0H0XLE0_9SPHN|nr:hypothetical protein AAV99_11790 [Aurantiacibacter marinus]
MSVADFATFRRDIRPAYRPVVFRNLLEDWPIVQEGRADPHRALALIERMDSGAPAEVMVAQPSEKGRFFYAPDMRGFNFTKDQATLSQLAQHLRQIESQTDPVGIYAGAASVSSHLPRFEAAHPFPMLGPDDTAIPRIWLGNATQVATHFDLSDNFAAVVAGRRVFTLFPPDATKDLYVGPLNVTLAGQPVSMVDPLAPDLDRYPDYPKAQDKALRAELGPGDVIYIPALWWHHVCSLDPVGVLINYWHNDTAHGGGFLALVHAMLAIRDQEPAQREAWRAWFDHMVFGENAPDAAAHLPDYAKGVNGPPSQQRDEQIRRFLVQVLSAAS